MTTQDRHVQEARANCSAWKRKPLLKKIYRRFFRQISLMLARLDGGRILEIGSGIGNSREVIPDCICTDLFVSPHTDCAASAYALPFTSGSISDIILFDVLHHLRYPGNAFDEFSRVLKPGGRVSVFEPYMGLAGLLVYGLFHAEPLGIGNDIQWQAPVSDSRVGKEYYASQSNATRIFFGKQHTFLLGAWDIVYHRKYSALSYILSGGYSGPQLYPRWLYPLMKGIDRICDSLPYIFGTRLHVVLQKK